MPVITAQFVRHGSGAEGGVGGGWADKILHLRLISASHENAQNHPRALSHSTSPRLIIHFVQI